MSIIGSLLLTALSLYQLIVIARVLLSWLPSVDEHNPVVRFLYQATEPVLAPIRQQLLSFNTPFDFSPMVAILGIFVLELLVRAIF
jgi:YggT family protein